MLIRFGVVAALVLALAGGPVGARTDAGGGTPQSVEQVAAGAANAPGTTVGRGAHRWPVSGLISYEVLRGEGGVKLGEAQHRWQHDGLRYSMATEVETTGLAGLLYRFHYVQYSEGRVLDSGLQPEHFRVEQAGKAPESARFDWPAGKVAIERRGKSTDYAIESADQDVLSVWHLIGLLNGRVPPSELTLVTNRAATPATLEMLGREVIQLPIGSVEAQRVRLRARSGRLTIDLWLSEHHHLLPVRILMTDDKGEVLDQNALAIELKSE